MAKSNPTLRFSPLYYFLLEVQTSKPTTKGGLFRWKSFANTHMEESLLGTESEEWSSGLGSRTYELVTWSNKES